VNIMDKKLVAVNSSAKGNKGAFDVNDLKQIVLAWIETYRFNLGQNQELILKDLEYGSKKTGWLFGDKIIYIKQKLVVAVKDEKWAPGGNKIITTSIRFSDKKICISRPIKEVIPLRQHFTTKERYLYHYEKELDPSSTTAEIKAVLEPIIAENMKAIINNLMIYNYDIKKKKVLAV
jgi:hypothetical protein